MAIDYSWMSEGGLLLDGQGDIALATNRETIVAMVRSRLKAAVDGWKLYRIGAGLDRYPGNTSDADMETTIKRQVQLAVSNGFLPASAFQISTLRFGSVIQVFVFLNQQLIATTDVNLTPSSNNTVA
jgi:hypothetical protein